MDMTGWWHDLRYSVRILTERPGFTIVAALTLALGIGANTALFTLAHEVLLKPLSYPEPERVVEVSNRWEGEFHGLAVPEYRAYRDDSDTLEALSAFGTGTLNLTGSGEPERLIAVFASHEIFRTLGIEPVLGRSFTEAEDRPGSDAVVVISHELWQRRFGGRRDTVSERILLNGVAHTVVGVLPAGARLPNDYVTGRTTDLWVPLALDPADFGDWGMHFLSAVARLKTSTDLARAQADLDRVVALMKERAAVDDAVSRNDFGAALVPVGDRLVGPVRPALLLVLGAVALVLLIACANVANLLLMRAETRRREMALRFALGAERWRLVRQGLIESVALSSLGGLGGWVLGIVGLSSFIRLSPPGLPRLWDVQLDAKMFVISLGLALVTGVVFGLIPAWRAARFGSLASLRGGDRAGEAPRRRRLRSLLVVTELALAVVLVVTAGLFVRTLWNLSRIDPGYRTENILTLRLALPESAYEQSTQTSAFFDSLRERLESLPEVEAAGGVTHLPLASPRGDWNFYYEERVIEPGEAKPRGDWQVVTPGYFRAMGVSLFDGRDISVSDDTSAPLVVLVNRSLAERYWPSESPVGRRIRMGGNDDNPFATIVGVVADIRHQELGAEPVPELYLPQAQARQILGRGDFRNLFYVVRTAGPPERLASAVRAEVRALDADVPLSDFRAMSDVRTVSLAVSRFAASILATFALVALALGAVGVFGVLSYLVAQRTRELGIRLAIGAAPETVSRMVVADGLKLAGTGISIGLIVSVLSGRLFANLLYGVVPWDPVTYAGVTLTLGLVALGATYGPARRAAHVDPVVALRSE